MKFLSLSIMLTGSVIVLSAQAPVVRARLDPAKGIIVGQPVHLIVDVLVPNFFSGSPDFPTFELENAIVVLPEETPQNINDHIAGQMYAGIRRTYFLYPQQPGDFRLPPAQLTVSYAIAPPKTTVAHPTLPQLTFHADIPEAAWGLSYFLPTTRLTMQQRWNSSLKNVQVGDTVERTITVTTVKMQGMLIPPLPMEAPPGIGVYPTEPKILDQKTDRGEFIFGRRIQSAKYLILRKGEYTLPAIELKWWSLNSNRLITSTLPAAHFVAAPNPSYVAELPPEAENLSVAHPETVNLRKWYRPTLIAGSATIAALIVIWLTRKYAPPLASFWKIGRERHLDSEAMYFRRLVRACRRNDANEAYQRLLGWLQRSGSTHTLNSFLERTNDDELTRQVNALTQILFANNPDLIWNGQLMSRHLKKHRDREILSLHLKNRTPLPLLNPLQENTPTR
jgi:hypothetical protein